MTKILPIMVFLGRDEVEMHSTRRCTEKHVAAGGMQVALSKRKFNFAANAHLGIAVFSPWGSPHVDDNVDDRCKKGTVDNLLGQLKSSHWYD